MKRSPETASDEVGQNAATTPASVPNDMSALIAIVLVITLLNVVIHWYLSSKFWSYSAYLLNDVFFDADPPNLAEHIFGARWMMFRHPMVLLLTRPLFLTASQLSNVKRDDLLALIVVLLGPVASGVKSVFIGLTGSIVRVPLFLITTFLFIDAFSFSGLIFGSVPELFPFTAAGLVGMIYLAARTMTGNTVNLKMWTIAGIVMGGITVTNLGVLPLIMLPSLIASGNRLRAALRKAALVTALSTLLLGAIVLVGVLLIRPTRHEDESRVQSVAVKHELPSRNIALRDSIASSSSISFIRFEPLQMILSAPRVITYCFVGPLPLAIHRIRSESLRICRMSFLRCRIGQEQCGFFRCVQSQYV